MGPAVDFENVIVEVLHPETQPGDAQVANRPQLVIGERAGLALEGDFLGLVPGQQ